jgi:inhibitor of cysteine peptidase
MLTDLNKPIVLKSTQSTFSISLPANATTGYSWFLSNNYPHSLIKVESYQYQAPTAQKPGEGGQAIFTFKAKKAAFTVPTSIHLHFSYQRPWELSPTKTQDVTILTVI